MVVFEKHVVYSERYTVFSVPRVVEEKAKNITEQ